MEYNDTLKKIHSFERLGMKLGLDRMQKLLGLMGNPEKKLKFIHVAGTNGKGSVCTMLASVMEQGGYKTGLYTSPAVIDFRERIKVNGQMIKKNSLTKITNNIINVLESIDDEDFKITEFELVTAIAFEYFFEEKCDVVVLETGLGGRFDATNVIEHPLLSVITSISFDHTKILGDTLEKIAFEKCGIIKEKCDVVVYPDQEAGVMDVIRNQAELKKSKVFIPDLDKVKIVGEGLFTGTKVLFDGLEYHMNFVGKHQINNLCTALKALKILGKRFNISQAAIFQGIDKAKVPARTEILLKNPLIILDGSHNISSVSALYDVVTQYAKGKNLKAIVGMLADKDVEASFSKILPIFKEVSIVSPNSFRALSVQNALSIALKYNKNSKSYDSLENAIEQAVSSLQDNDALIMFGSLYLSSEIKKIFKQKYSLDTLQKI